ISMASELREKFKLTYFDSLHCASAILYDGVILSVDEAYDKVSEVHRIDPRSLL
ncbi:MAG: VapC toxin family PIN domain ribonuclease, partial [Thermoproteota archaeon]